jgi:hypothetical protein
MDQSILKTLLEALEVYEGDELEKLNAHNWLACYYEFSRMTSGQKEELHLALLAADSEEGVRDHEDVMRDMYEMIANLQSEQESVKV